MDGMRIQDPAITCAMRYGLETARERYGTNCGHYADDCNNEDASDGGAEAGNGKKGRKKMKSIIRSEGSGVWYAEVVSNEKDTYTLTKARRIWSWEGANTLSDISLDGCNDRSKISRPVDEVIVYNVMEQITCTEKAEEALDAIKPW